MTLSFEKLSSLQQINEKNLLLTLEISKLPNVELILEMQIKEERNQGHTDPSFYLSTCRQFGTCIPEMSRYHHMKFWVRLISWCEIELKNEEFTKRELDLQ